VLLAEIDKSEVLQPIDNLRNTMVIMSVISGFILIAISIVVIHTLLSWNKKLESANKQLQRQDIMQREFINVAAHELRTPIQPILALTEHLREKIKNKDQAQLLDVVIRNAQRLKKLSNDILEVTKIESNTLNVYKEWFSLDRLISETVKDFENSLKDKDIGFECHNPSSSCNLFADQSRIRQVISNLIGNSVKFIGKEGTVSITVEKKKSKDSIGNKKEVVVVSIKDNGIGIDKEILPNLFTKFASKSFQGTGLGLYISRKIVEAHGGKIEAENNNNGKGATFSFTLPLENTD
jgi:signal transduction histidine kinase